MLMVIPEDMKRKLYGNKFGKFAILNQVYRTNNISLYTLTNLTSVNGKYQKI